MKIYFDTLTMDESNLAELDSSRGNDWWLTSRGTVIKRTLHQMNLEYHSINDLDEPGVYFIDVNGDPNWWGGVAKGTHTPKHILEMIPESLADLVRQKKIRLIIAADKEGGPMVNQHFDVFRKTTDIIRKRKLPTSSVLIIQGNKKIAGDYKKWLEKNNEEKLYEVQYSNHFARVAYDDKLPTSPCILDAINSADSLDYNSLNRVYRPHRGAHLYYLAANDLLDKGKVSCNQMHPGDNTAAKLADVNIEDFKKTVSKNYPRFLDGDWSNTNAAWNYNADLYRTTLLTVVTETIFADNTCFITEKIFKPITLGHPFLLIAGEGTLRSLRELGFKTDFLGFESYDEILDPYTRFYQIHKILNNWIKTPREDKIKKIQASMDSIMHNFNLIRESNFYTTALEKAIQSSERYFNE